ncbi:MAG: OmpH family outer membrane protein [Saprospirales bacterium]|nr:MAG: OmpH family outer membrane protein [Saprospirales bacterium]
MMYKFLFAIPMLLLMSFAISAQQVAVVDVSKVLESVEDYRMAQRELDNIAAAWQRDIAEEYDKIRSLYNRYQAEQVLLSEEQRAEREEEIMEKEKSVRELQRARFGPEGELFRKRQELVSPIQDRIFGLIQEYATSRGFDIIFDKSSDAGLLYVSERFDKTDDIIRRVR